MAVLVEAQGELVNQIEKNVIDAEAYTRKGVAELKKANVYQRKSRKVSNRLRSFAVLFAAAYQRN